MKRNKLYLLLPFIMAVVTTSCKKNFLQRDPVDQYSSGTFWKNENDVKIGLTGVYSNLSRETEGFGSYLPYWESLSDNAFIGGGGWYNISTGALESTTGGIVNDAYNVNYASIATCNYFLDNVSKAGLSAATLAQYQAEVRTMRAYFYFQLSEIYGDLILQLSSDANIKPTKSPKADVVKQILADLDFSIANLPNTSYTGRAVKGTAQGLKLKVLLFNERWAEASLVGKDLIGNFGDLTSPNHQPFNLWSNYKGLFFKPDQRDARNREIMLAARYEAPNRTHTLDYRLGWTQWITLQPIKDLVDAYEMKDGSPNGTGSLYDPTAPYENRDTRLKNSIYVPNAGMEWKYLNAGETDQNKSNIYKGTFAGIVTGFLPVKYLDEKRAPTGYSTISDQDIPILRFADVLLMYAEAQNESTGPTSEAYSAANAVRNRSGQPNLPAGLSQLDFRQRVRNERRVELALEGQRYFDLKRWKTAATVLPQITNPGGAKRSFLPKHYYFPIPQSEVDILKNTQSLDIQNPNYK